MHRLSFILLKDRVSFKEGEQTIGFSLAVPRQPSNDLFEIFEIERGVSADDEAKDDPGSGSSILVLPSIPRKEVEFSSQLGYKTMGFINRRK